MTLLGWLDERVDLTGLKRALLDREVPDRLTWWHTLGSATLAVFVLQVVSGTVLATYYSPTPDHAYASIRYMEHSVAGGAFLRGMHHWGGSAMVGLVVAHLLRVFVFGAYKYPREINWMLGVGLLLIVLGFGFTGYLLPWDEKAYWATQVGTGMAGTTPLVGPWLVVLLRGGADLGTATVARFYAFHVLWLPLLLVLLIIPHLAMVVRQGIAPEPRALEIGAPARTNATDYAEYYRAAYAATKRHGKRFWPDIIAKDAVVAALTLGVIAVLAVAFPPRLEMPADPTDVVYVPRPEWYFLPLYQLLKLVPGSMESVIAVGVPTLLLLTLLALPLVDRGSRRRLTHRPIALVSLTLVLVGSALLLGSALREPGPRRPPEVSRPLTPVEMAGRALFSAQQCGSCHIVGSQGTSHEGPALTEVGLRHSAAWMHSYMEKPKRFHPDSKMPAFGWPKLSHPEIEELAQYLSTLRGSADPTVQPQYHDTFP